jgi:hypothetical protein
MSDPKAKPILLCASFAIACNQTGNPCDAFCFSRLYHASPMLDMDIML